MRICEENEEICEKGCIIFRYDIIYEDKMYKNSGEEFFHKNNCSDKRVGTFERGQNIWEIWTLITSKKQRMTFPF